MMKIKQKIKAVSCSALLIILSLSLLTGCKSHPLSAGKQALTVVGTVGDYDVTYEELYFLASNYKSDGMTEDELWELVGENIITNYAILTLCAKYPTDYDEDTVDDTVQAYIDQIIEEDFGGSRKSYIASLEEAHMTDHYVRFTARVDALYDSLAASLASSSEIETDEEKVIDYIENNFVRTWHLMIANNDGDSKENNLANAQNALNELRDGKTTMYELIGGKLNEDLLIPIDGYTFGRGSMEQAYEDAAYALNVGEYSDVVSAKGELASGEYVDCYYVIQRLALDRDFISENYASLYETYETAIVASKLADTKKELEFVPNEYAKSLKITELEEIDAGTDTFAVIIVCICVVSAAAIAAAVIFTVKHFKKKQARLRAEAKSKKALKSGKGKKHDS